MARLIRVGEDGIYVNTDAAIATLTATQRKLIWRSSLQAIMRETVATWLDEVWHTGDHGKWEADRPATVLLKGHSTVLVGGSKIPRMNKQWRIPDDGSMKHELLARPQYYGTTAVSGVVVRYTEANARKAFWMRRGRRPIDVYHQQITEGRTRETAQREPTFMVKRQPAPRPPRDWIRELGDQLLKEINPQA